MGRTVSVRSNRKATDNGNVSRLNAVICWRTPSSRTRKCLASNLSIGAPVFLFFASTPGLPVSQFAPKSPLVTYFLMTNQSGGGCTQEQDGAPDPQHSSPHAPFYADRS